MCQWPMALYHKKIFYRRSQDFVWGCTFSCQKSWRPFFSRRPQRPSKYASKSNPPSKNCPKNWLLLWLWVTSCPARVHLHIFPVNYAWKKFFHRPGGAGAPTAPLATPMSLRQLNFLYPYACTAILKSFDHIHHHHSLFVQKQRWSIVQIWRHGLWTKTRALTFGD